MPPRELPTETLDVDNRGVEDLSDPTSTSTKADEEELAQAEARAETARARALQLRQLADATDDAAAAADDDDDGDVTLGEAAPAARSRKLRRPGRKALAILAAVGCICTSLTGCGYLLWHHRGEVQQRQRTAEFAAAAHDAVLTMLTINARTARADVQRFIDDTTGEFKGGILLSAEDFVKAVEDSKANSKGTVQAVAVQSMTDDSAIVLVAAKSEITKPGDAKPESKYMRVVVDVRRDGEQLKVSRVEFVP
jgi:Mce-associated membrane protein